MQPRSEPRSEQLPPPPVVVASPPPAYNRVPAAPASRTEPQGYDNYIGGQASGRDRDDYDTIRDSRAPTDSAMQFTKFVLVGAAIALIGFFGWRLFLQPRPVSAPDLAATASVTGVGTQQVTQISPAQMRRTNVATQAVGVPDAAGPVIAQLSAGSVLDVTGQIQVAGVNWLRVTIPNDSSKSGFVREDQLANLGDGALTLTPTDPLSDGQLPQTKSPGPVVPIVEGPIEPRDPSTLYIASLQANIRQEANSASTKVGSFEFTDAITVIGQRSVGAAIWYQVQLPSGGSGWINARLVSAQPRDIPLDRGSATPPPPVPKKQNTPSDQPTEDIATLDSKPDIMAVSPGTTMRVEATVANLRKVAGATGNSIIEVLGRDTLVSVEDVQILNGVPWYRVTSPNGAQGWVSGRTVVTNR